jgi:hypothetical protein
MKLPKRGEAIRLQTPIETGSRLSQMRLIEARDLLASTVPTTKAGLAAAVEWIMEYERGSIPETSVRFLRTLARSPLPAGG